MSDITVTKENMMNGKSERDSPIATVETVYPKSADPVHGHGEPQFLGVDASGDQNAETPVLEKAKPKWFAYFKTKQFFIVLVLGQVLSLCDTGTNTFTSLLGIQGTNIPTFQNLFNYVFLNIVFTSYTLYRYGFKKWAKLILYDGWKFFILSFCDVQGNYFTILAYRYTTMLSAQLINFWAIVVVVIISFLFLHVRYHWTQIVGILVCIGGMGLLIASDKIHHINDYAVPDQVKGDLFALVGATFYGLTNVAEEFLTSKRPLYEVVGQIGFWGMIINGVQCGIFDRHAFAHATWNGKVGGYLVGYTLLLSLFYSLAPIMFRLSSAAFFNISLLTGNFWGVCIGVKVLHEKIHTLYPIAFVLIILGLLVYFVMMSTFGDQVKPWLGPNQDLGISGVGTAKRRVEEPDAIV
ncbi:MAG: hypothetical protein M1819_004541 [Sarea resinae]|nr:MAG: hypothetical protein M1819_004541 [Sarea resinae]